MKNNIIEIKDLECPKKELLCALKNILSLPELGNKIKNYSSASIPITDVNLLPGTFYTVSTVSGKQLYVK